MRDGIKGAVDGGKSRRALKPGLGGVVMEENVKERKVNDKVPSDGGPGWFNARCNAGSRQCALGLQPKRAYYWGAGKARGATQGANEQRESAGGRGTRTEKYLLILGRMTEWWMILEQLLKAFSTRRSDALGEALRQRRCASQITSHGWYRLRHKGLILHGLWGEREKH
ncbi:uncharacterized protein BDV14DRAFT_30362 [Aspergillus stella-maris]|uniref:uncharacterized protein n=1 Tax=Aspergillus stella-maris TaxID=1810926 RepID=UPI003CCD6BF3